MKRSDSTVELSKALAATWTELEDPTKSSSNPHFKSSYADLSQVLLAVRPVLAKNGLSVAQGPTRVEGWLVLSTQLLHSSGEYLETETPLLMESARGQTMQALGSAITYARRYALQAIIGSAGKGDDDDGNKATPAKSMPKIIGPPVGLSMDDKIRTEFSRLIKRGESQQDLIQEIDQVVQTASLGDRGVDDPKQILALPEELKELVLNHLKEK